MSEPKKQMRIETAPETAAQDTAKPERAKRKGLPAAGELWSPVKHDRVVMDRLARALEGVPPFVIRRITPWVVGVMAEAAQDAPSGPPPVTGPQVATSWNPNARAYEQG